MKINHITFREEEMCEHTGRSTWAFTVDLCGDFSFFFCFNFARDVHIVHNLWLLTRRKWYKRELKLYTQCEMCIRCWCMAFIGFDGYMRTRRWVSSLVHSAIRISSIGFGFLSSSSVSLSFVEIVARILSDWWESTIAKYNFLPVENVCNIVHFSLSYLEAKLLQQ